MSIETWMAEFYPTVDITSYKLATDAECAAHGARKWTGLLSENLQRHGCRLDDDVADIVLIRASGVQEGRLRMGITSSYNCALCQKHLVELPQYTVKRDYCKSCPLFKYTGKSCLEKGSLYTAAVSYHATEAERDQAIRKLVEALEACAKQ